MLFMSLLTLHKQTHHKPFERHDEVGPHLEGKVHFVLLRNWLKPAFVFTQSCHAAASTQTLEIRQHIS